MPGLLRTEEYARAVFGYWVPPLPDSGLELWVAYLPWTRCSWGGAAGNECAELACTNASWLLRESDEPDRILAVSPDSLAALLTRIRPDRTS